MKPAADLILYNANIITLDKTRPRATAVATKGKRIAAVGHEQAVLRRRVPSTQFVDCQGRTVVPGFNDAHCHPIALAASLLAVDCGPGAVRCIADIDLATLAGHGHLERLDE